MASLLLILAVIGFLLAAGPALLFAANWRQYTPPPAAPDSAEPGADPPPAVSLLIPARNEEAGITECLRAALASTGVILEVIVLDDQSTDATAERVRAIAAIDQRVRLETAPPLPPGWCGKQHACWVLAGLSSHPVLAFIDADVRLEPAGLGKSVAFQRRSGEGAGAGAGLVSGVPRQVTETFLESLLLPLIHFVLLGFLPLQQMRRSARPSLGAGCGQFFVTTREAYGRSGGHAAIRGSLHDGITLPRAYRRAGVMTDLFDATTVARCRMYRSGQEVWRGLAKNATEGMASPRAIIPWTLLLLGGQVMPVVLLIAALGGPNTPGHVVAMALGAAAWAASCAVRLAAARRFRQSWVGALLHPVGVTLLLMIQWEALVRQALGRPAVWRGRTYRALPAETQTGARLR